MDKDYQKFNMIKLGEIQVFDMVFKEYYPLLVNFAYGILKDQSLAEEQVQEVFTILWEKKSSFKEDISLFPYLLTSVRNKSINIINRKKVNENYLSHAQREHQNQILNYDYDYEDFSEEMIQKLYSSLEKIPPKCREVFELSRFEGLSHKSIESKLGISIKTVENHITKAMKILKNEFFKKIYFFITL